MALNLLRNSRVFFTTNVNATTGIVQATGFSNTNTSEIQVLEGFTFSQNSNNEAITISEAGTTPARGQRSFNTSLAPVDFSFSTYMRPYKATNVKSEDYLVWNALTSGTGVSAGLATTGTFGTTCSYVASTNILTITGSTMAFTDTTIGVGSDVLISNITVAGGTASDVKTVTGPARILTMAAGTITFRMHNQGPVDVLTAAITATTVKFHKSGWAEHTNQAIVGFHDSNRNQLQKAGLIVVVDTVSYQIDNVVMSQATIDFGLDGIATIQWTGQATALTETASLVTASGGTFGGPLTGTYLEKITTASYITNKLSTCTLKQVKALGGVSVANGVYYVALTGGSITINNNVSYVTPANLGVVNQPATYYTGTRSISGSVTAYLNTGARSGFTGGGTGNLLKNMLAAAATAVEPMFTMEIAIGGSSNALKIELQMPSVSISVPSVDVQSVISTSINFTAAASEITGTAGEATTLFDLERTNDLTVRYYAP